MAMNLKSCAAHGYYSGGFDSCPECTQPAVILSTGGVQDAKVVTVVGGSKKRAKAAKTPNTTIQKPLSAHEVSRRLANAGLGIGTLTVDHLATGVLANALYDDGNGTSEAVFVAYVALVDIVAEREPGAGKYRHRMVSGVAA